MRSITTRKLAKLSIGTALSLALAAPAFAQDAQTAAAQDVAPQSADDADEGQTVVVTGSRLARDPNAIAPSPVQTVTIEELRQTGQTDITETLREIPALLSSAAASDSIERGIAGVGQSSLNLRGLGSNRTLVLVNGRRHIAGVAGTQVVDTATIPRALIESVDVLTGGASSIYGADAVTGVVNFKLREKYEGIEFNAQAGISDKGDGATYAIDGIIGRNLFENRLNVTLAGSYSRNESLQFGDRDFTRGNSQATTSLNYDNPARRFQVGDITQAGTPNFFQRFATNQGRYPIGFVIPTAAQFATQFPGRTPTAAEQALIDRAGTAPSNALGRFPTFAISSASGLIARADFDSFTADINRNGVSDCNESYIGFRYANIDGLGGCYITQPGGGVQIFRDGVIASDTNQFGGDGIGESADFLDLIPRTERYDLNLLTSFEFSEAATFFAELKWAHATSLSQSVYPNGFYDQLFVAADNPFIPAALRPDATAGGGLRVSRDFGDIPTQQDANRDTYRAVLGLRGALSPNLRYQVYGNYGRTENENTSISVLPDRLFAAIDVVQGPNGPTCASNITPGRRHPGSEFFPVIGPGVFTFTPGANSGCQPINLFNGTDGVNAAAFDFVTERTTTRAKLEQYVFAAELTGDTGGFFTLPGGAVQFALGAEYRKEKSQINFDPLVLGILPATTTVGTPGAFVGTVDRRQNLVFDGQTRTQNTGGEFDVKEVFGELRIPIIADRPFFHELTLEGAARYSDYSTVGNTFTWNVNGIYAPIRDVRVRGTYSVAIRAPNIGELFSPQQGTTFRPIDPCNAGAIAALAASSDPANQQRAARRRANCLAAGLPAGYTDPLTARFSGSTGGNPDLTEETAKTWTVGGVIQPRFLPGLTISGDYYNIEIEDGIAAVTAQNIVNSCYEAATFPNQYCDLITRGANGGFTFIRQTQLNFGRLETSGIDATVNYRFALGEHRFNLRATGNWTEKLNQFFDPIDPSVIDPEKGENGFPEWAAVGSVDWTFRGVSLGYRLQYIGAQALAAVEIERQEVEFGNAGNASETFVHDLSFGYEVNDRFRLYGGINNLTDEQPFINRSAYPVSPVGRFLFLGVNTKF
jgi:outer membrane receptor protein involved in Fe transport